MRGKVESAPLLAAASEPPEERIAAGLFLKNQDRMRGGIHDVKPAAGRVVGEPRRPLEIAGHFVHQAAAAGKVKHPAQDRIADEHAALSVGRHADGALEPRLPTLSTAR